MSQKGVWKLQDVRDQALANTWSYTATDGGGATPGTLSEATLLFVNYDTKGYLNAQNDNTCRSSPVQVPGCWTWISPVRSNVAAVKCDGTLWAWGGNSSGAMGQNSIAIATYSSPVQIAGTTWCCVFGTTSSDRFYAIKADGTAWVWGNNSDGQLGLNDLVNRSSPTQLPGTTWCWFDGSDSSVIAVKTNGTLWTWGAAESGSHGVGDDTVNRSSPVQVPGTTWCKAVGLHQSVKAMKTDGTLWAWGGNSQGQLGDGTTAGKCSPIQIPGTTWCYLGYGGYEFSGAIKTDGSLWMIGKNSDGFLGDNTNIARSSPVQIPGNWIGVSSGQDSTTAIRSDNTLWGWGKGARAGLNSNVQYSSPVQIPGTWKFTFTRNDGVVNKRT